MKMMPLYSARFACKDADGVFDYLVSTLKVRLITWSYFVNWEKVFENVKEIELDLNKLNYLIGKAEFDDAFRHLLKSDPGVARSLPALVVRDGEATRQFNILVDYSNKRLVYEDYDFRKKSLTDEDIERYLTFVKETGVKKLIESRTIKNLVDYMIGVEAGLDSNARKNRGGDIMEDIVESFISDICKRNSYRYLAQANAAKIKDAFDIDVPVDKSSRRYDFAIYNGRRLFLVETNFYGSGGSKLKATAGEYRNLSAVLAGKYPLIWITDGAGWNSTLRPLREAFDEMEYILNLSMLENRVLEQILAQSHI